MFWLGCSYPGHHDESLCNVPLWRLGTLWVSLIVIVVLFSLSCQATVKWFLRYLLTIGSAWPLVTECYLLRHLLHDTGGCPYHAYWDGPDLFTVFGRATSSDQPWSPKRHTRIKQLVTASSGWPCLPGRCFLTGWLCLCKLEWANTWPWLKVNHLHRIQLRLEFVRHMLDCLPMVLEKRRACIELSKDSKKAPRHIFITHSWVLLKANTGIQKSPHLCCLLSSPLLFAVCIWCPL